MMKYEIKKIFSKPSSKFAVMLLFIVVCVTCLLAVDVRYMNEDGTEETGYAAARRLREAQKEWAGILNEEKLKKIIKENTRISAAPQAMSKNSIENNIAYSWTQGFYEIRALLNASYADSFQSYDYYRADSLTAKDAWTFYQNRTALLHAWLEHEAKGRFSDVEKDYLIRQYDSLKIPFYYDYMKGWTQLLEYLPAIHMITTLILGFLVGSIFSNEFSWKSDAVFFAAKYGRNKAVAAKVKAGVSITTIIYWAVVLFYSIAVLSYLGTDGAACPVQADASGWKCFYHIQVWQKYLLSVTGGYIGCLFLSLLTMLVSATSKSAVLAVLTPFVMIFIPSFLGSIESPVINKILGLLPDRLLQVNTALGYFDLYTFGKYVLGAIPILFVLYSMLTILLFPIIYQTYKKSRLG